MDTSNKFPIDPPSPREKQPFTSGDGPVDPAHASAGGNRKILIVDDNAIVLKAFQLKLKGCGFNVITAADATEGIAAARREKPEAIILDLNFPPGQNFSSLNWSGLHILQWLKRYKDVADIPILILTADDPGKSKDLVLAAGAAAFFQKPVDLKVFLAEILKLIDGRPRA
jgi:DNA-binding response OmpR family regulator